MHGPRLCARGVPAARCVASLRRTQTCWCAHACNRESVSLGTAETDRRRTELGGGARQSHLPIQAVTGLTGEHEADVHLASKPLISKVAGDGGDCIRPDVEDAPTPVAVDRRVQALFKLLESLLHTSACC